MGAKRLAEEAPLRRGALKLLSFSIHLQFIESTLENRQLSIGGKGNYFS